jgi:hypothetical protein
VWQLTKSHREIFENYLKLLPKLHKGEVSAKELAEFDIWVDSQGVPMVPSWRKFGDSYERLT